VSVSGAAQRLDGTAALDYAGLGGAEAPAAGESTLKQAVAERLAAHRAQRAAVKQQLADLTAQKMSASEAGRGSTKVRDAVAARYQQSPSYRDFLAAEAERALKQAQAEAEIAARNARAVADAKVQLLEELDQWDNDASQQIRAEDFLQHAQNIEVRGELAHALADIALGAQELILEKQFEEAQFEAAPAAPRLVERSLPMEVSYAAGLSILDDQMDSAYAETHEVSVESQPIPANIIEFPRQLVAPKKARPRLAEGPLREEAPQLRIFEVDAEQISAEPAVQVAAAAPDWQSMKLETTATIAHAPQYAQTQFTLQPQTASISRRMMAAAVDAVCIGTAFVSFVAVAAEMIGRGLQTMPKPFLGAAAGAVLFLFYLAYELLFFSLNGDTPGMRYARIGLCTFGDRNPTRRAMRRRIFATLLAIFPVGLGLLWACLDDERLGWHDRMSRMYQRAY
jgi:uncharacterized RDD family membrane protein YckC